MDHFLLKCKFLRDPVTFVLGRDVKWKIVDDAIKLKLSVKIVFSVAVMLLQSMLTLVLAFRKGI